MPNIFVNLPIPINPAIGAIANASEISGEKIIVIEGPADPSLDPMNGILVIEASMDGTIFVSVRTVNLSEGRDVSTLPSDYNYIRIRRDSGMGGNVSATVMGESLR